MEHQIERKHALPQQPRSAAVQVWAFVVAALVRSNWTFLPEQTTAVDAV
jgi:hypothetical protein